jgi:hypothetical protein
METPSGSSLRAGRPTVRNAELPGGNRMTKKPTPAAERQRETRHADQRPPADRRGATGRTRTLAVRRESALTWSGEPRRRRSRRDLEPTDKRDATANRPRCVDPRTTHPPTSERIVRPQDHQNHQGLLEPDALKGARPVLRGPGAERRRAYPTRSAMSTDGPRRGPDCCSRLADDRSTSETFVVGLVYQKLGTGQRESSHRLCAVASSRSRAEPRLLELSRGQQASWVL